MAARRPLVNVNGSIAELPIGDTLIGAGGSAAISQVNLNLGAVPVYNKMVTAVDAAALTTSRINAWVQAKANGIADELEDDHICVSANCTVDGTINFFIAALPGPVTGFYSVNYTIG